MTDELLHSLKWGGYWDEPKNKKFIKKLVKRYAEGPTIEEMRAQAQAHIEKRFFEEYEKWEENAGA